MGEDLIACIVEGTAERVIMNILLDHHRLIFEREDLLEQELLKCRSARVFEDQYLGKRFNKKIVVYRILDSKRENFSLRRAYADKVSVVNVITAPEIEILVIIKENKYQDYMKYKSKMKPSDYCIQYLNYKDVKSKSFISEYFHNINDLVEVIKKYRSIHEVKNNELSLADLLS